MLSRNSLKGYTDGQSHAPNAKRRGEYAVSDGSYMGAYHPYRIRGFTFVEALVSLGLFSLLVLLVTSGFAQLAGMQRDIDAKQQVLNDFRFAVDVMVKEMTFGSMFPGGCANGCLGISYVTRSRPDMPYRRVQYRQDTVNDKVEKALQSTHGLCETYPFDSNCFQPFHSGDVKVESMKFYIHNKSVAYSQVMITVQIDGTIYPGMKEEEAFSITTTVTPRTLQDPSSAIPGSSLFAAGSRVLPLTL